MCVVFINPVKKRASFLEKHTVEQTQPCSAFKITVSFDSS